MICLSDEYWDSWRRRRGGPFFRSFGDIDKIFRKMEELMDRELKGLSKTAPKDLVRERTLPDGSKTREWGPFVYGYSMTIGPDGKPRFREFGNVKPETRLGRPRINIKEQREPLIDIMQTDNEVKVFAELPGVEKEDIKLHGTKDSMTISVDTPKRKYRKKVELPSEVDPKTAMASYKNGVLEVTIQQKKESNGEPIKL